MKKAFFILLFIIFSLTSSFAAETVHKEVLPSGMTVLIQPVDEDITAIEVFVKTGVMNEEKSQCGISGLITPLMLRGTNTVSARDINMEIESLGGTIQAISNQDYSEYYIVSTSEYFDTDLRIISDIIIHPAFLQEEIDKERQNILLEMEKQQNRPFARLNDMFNATLYQRHPYGRPALGIRENIEKFTREDIINFYNANYVTKNIVVSIAGKVDVKSTLEKVKTAFSGLPDSPPPDIHNPDEPKPLLWREDYRASSGDAGWFFLGYPAPSILSPDFPAMEVLQLVIGGGMNSRMWVKLREKKGLAYDLGSFMTPTIGPGRMITFIATTPGKVNESRKAILDEVRDIRQGKITNEEIDIMKTYRIGQYYINEETVRSKAYNLGLYEILGAGYQYYLDYPALIQKVTKDDMVRVANEYLTNPVFVVISPKRPDGIQGDR
ncbi:MAG: pitrilysin family protein [Candidatus Eremiobacterota bacterium]